MSGGPSGGAVVGEGMKSTGGRRWGEAESRIGYIGLRGGRQRRGTGREAQENFVDSLI